MGEQHASPWRPVLLCQPLERTPALPCAHDLVTPCLWVAPLAVSLRWVRGRFGVGNDSLDMYEQLTSANGQYRLTMQPDGNLVLQRAGSAGVLWQSGTAGLGGQHLFLSSRCSLSIVKDLKSLATVWTAPGEVSGSLPHWRPEATSRRRVGVATGVCGTRRPAMPAPRPRSCCFARLAGPVRPVLHRRAYRLWQLHSHQRGQAVQLQAPLLCPAHAASAQSAAQPAASAAQPPTSASTAPAAAIAASSPSVAALAPLAAAQASVASSPSPRRYRSGRILRETRHTKRVTTLETQAVVLPCMWTQ